MKRHLTVGLLLSMAAHSQTMDLGSKLQEIDAEIAKIKSYQSQGVASPVFMEQLKMLDEEKQKYLKLQKTESRPKKKTEKKAVVSAEVKDKKFPTVLQKDMENLKAYNDETIPLEKRYALILDEMQKLYTITDKLKDLPAVGQDDNVKNLIQSNEAKLAELEKLKTRYELTMRDTEQSELEEMKKHGVRIGAMVDLYYQWDFNEPKRRGGNNPDLLYRNYTNRHNDFTVNLLELNLYKSFKNLDVYADVDFGEQAEQNESETGDGVSHHIGQAFLRYKMPQYNNLTFTAGKFYTHFGYEVSKNIENRTNSRPFYYTLVCPFRHEGVSLTQSGIGAGFGYGLYVYDKSDDRPDNDSDKSYGLQLSFTKNKLSAIYNMITGSEGDQTTLNRDGDKRTQHEIILTHATTDRLTLVLDALVGEHKNFDSANDKDARWVGIVAYADFKVTAKDSLNFRYENFKDQTSNTAASNLYSIAGGNTVTSPTVDAYTLTNRYFVGNGSEFRIEYRYDMATQEIFRNKDNDFKKSQSTLALGWLYSI